MKGHFLVNLCNIILKRQQDVVHASSSKYYCKEPYESL